MDLKSGISEIIGIKADDIPASIEYRIIESIKEAGYESLLSITPMEIQSLPFF